MKKILAIALTLTLVFALAVSSSAATLSSAWEEKFNAAGTSEGVVTVDGSNAINLAAPAGADSTWWTSAGVAYGEKVAIDGLEIAFNLAAFEWNAAFSYNSYFALTVHGAPVSDFGIGPMVGSRAYSLVTTDTNGFVASFGGDTLGLFVDALGGSYSLLERANVTAGADSTLKLVVEEGAIKFLVNGTKVTVYDEEAEAEVDFAIEAANILDADGKAYIAFALVGEGGITNTTGVTIKTINGQAANSFNGQAAGGSTPVPGPADIEVVAIAGAMIVALMAAAFVVKARKA
ncbi:MAG: hypothetical protein IJD95_05645 [Clostridia bacterium]|nr:hypothetical protein [Clostridia bacterium]